MKFGNFIKIYLWPNLAVKGFSGITHFQALSSTVPISASKASFRLLLDQGGVKEALPESRQDFVQASVC